MSSSIKTLAVAVVLLGSMLTVYGFGPQTQPTSPQNPAPAQPQPDPDGQVIKSEKQTFKIEVIARDIETPWGLAFLPDGRLLITERPGRLRIVEKGKLLPEAVKGTPKVWEKQDGGLLDVEVHPQVREERLDLLVILGNTAGLRGAAAD